MLLAGPASCRASRSRRGPNAARQDSKGLAVSRRTRRSQKRTDPTPTGSGSSQENTAQTFSPTRDLSQLLAERRPSFLYRNAARMSREMETLCPLPSRNATLRPNISKPVANAIHRRRSI
jgi:hypothetical protein